MHGHDNLIEIAMPSWLSLVPILLTLGIVAFMSGLVPIPVGYERGKIKWLIWCGTGMHAHTVYWHSGEDGSTDRGEFQSIHPRDYDAE